MWDPDLVTEWVQATLQAMSSCVKKLTLERKGEAFPDYILVDGNRLPDDFSKEKAQFVIKVHIYIWLTGADFWGLGGLSFSEPQMLYFLTGAVQGDAECHVIAAASILAKVTRDRMMLAYDK